MKRKYALVSFLLASLLGALIVLPGTFFGKGVFTLAGDLNVQQIPFLTMINNSIKSGDFLWTWYNDMGSNFIGAFSFYNLFSPFNMLTYLFPATWVPYLIAPMFIFKYGITGLLSYLFLKRYVKDRKWAVLGSLLYTFSGYQLASAMFFHFHDVVAFFPLLLYTLDNLMYDNKKGEFIIAVALCAITNWFFFIGEIIFGIIYIIAKCLTKEYKINLEKLTSFLFEGFVGTCVAGFVLVPSFMFTIGNPRLSTSWTKMSLLTYSFDRYLGLIKSFILPAEALTRKAIIFRNEFSSMDLFLPLIGSIFVFSTLWKKPKKWYSVLFLVLLVFMFVPILNSSFILLQKTYYARWFYMPVLMMSLMSIIALEKKYSIKPGIIILTIISIIFGVLLYIFGRNNQVIFDLKQFIVLIITSVVGLILTIIFFRIKKERRRYLAFLIGIGVVTVFWGNYLVYKYRFNSFNQFHGYIEYLNSAQYLDKYNDARSNSDFTCNDNLGYIASLNNIKSWNSNINSSEFLFLASIGRGRGMVTLIDSSDKTIHDLLGVKYIISCNEETTELNGYEYLESSGKYHIFVNPDYKPFGYAVNKYISMDDYIQVDMLDRPSLLLDTILLTNEQIEKYGYVYNKEKLKYKVLDFEYGVNGFTSTVESSKDTLAIYMIPYDKGWSATVNGTKTEVIPVDHGMMAVLVKEGKNNVEFRYMTPGLRLGLAISTGSILVYLGYVIYLKRREGRNK